MRTPTPKPRDCRATLATTVLTKTAPSVMNPNRCADDVGELAMDRG